MIRALVAVFIAGCSGQKQDCRDSCPETISMASQALSPGARMTVPMVKMTVPRDAISIAGVPDDRPLHALFDGVEVPVEPFSNVSRYRDGFFDRFVRVRAGARVLEVFYEGAPVTSVRVYAFDLSCISAKPSCAL